MEVDRALFPALADGRVYLDAEHPRVCIRGPEERDRDDLGYQWLADDEVFPFLELRAAALDLRGGYPFDEVETAKRVGAQLDTLIEHGVTPIAVPENAGLTILKIQDASGQFLAWNIIL